MDADGKGEEIVRRAARIDKNQPEIVAALRKIGASVHYIKEPVDLMIGYRGKTKAIEIKNPEEDWQLTQQQKDFFAEFKGEAYIVENVSQALEAARK